MQRRAEELLAAQARIRSAYWSGDIDRAIALYDAEIGPALRAVDHRVRALALRLAHSFLTMSKN